MSYNSPRQTTGYHQGTGTFPGAAPGGKPTSTSRRPQTASSASPRGSTRPVSLAASLALFLGWLLLLIAMCTSHWSHSDLLGTRGPLHGSGTSTSAHIVPFLLCLAGLVSATGALGLVVAHGFGVGAFFAGENGGRNGDIRADSAGSRELEASRGKSAFASGPVGGNRGGGGGSAGPGGSSRAPGGPFVGHRAALMGGGAGVLAAVLVAIAVSIYAAEHHLKLQGTGVRYEWSFDLAVAAAVFLLIGGIVALGSYFLEVGAERARERARGAPADAEAGSRVVEVFRPHPLAFVALLFLLVALVLALIAVSTDTWSQVKSFVPPGSGFRSITDWRSRGDGGRATLAFMIICVIVCLGALVVGTMFAIGGSRATGAGATALSFFACLCAMIAISVYGGEVHKNLPEEKRYGFSFHLAVSAFVLLLVAALLFLVTHLIRVPVLVRREQGKGATFVPPPPAPAAHLPPAPPQAPPREPSPPPQQQQRSPRRRRVPIEVEIHEEYDSSSSSSSSTTTTTTTTESSSGERRAPPPQPQPQPQPQPVYVSQPVVPPIPVQVVRHVQSPRVVRHEQPQVIYAASEPPAEAEYIDASPRRIVAADSRAGAEPVVVRAGSPTQQTVISPTYFGDGTPISSRGPVVSTSPRRVVAQPSQQQPLEQSRVSHAVINGSYNGRDAYVSDGTGYVRTTSPRVLRTEQYSTPIRQGAAQPQPPVTYSPE